MVDQDQDELRTFPAHCDRHDITSVANSFHLEQIQRVIFTIDHLDNDVSARRLLACWQINKELTAVFDL